MAAPINFSINLTDTTGGGLGPYTATVLKNPTAASGGTDVTSQAGGIVYNGTVTNTLSNPTGVINPQELLAYAAHVVGDVIATANQNDPLN